MSKMIYLVRACAAVALAATMAACGTTAPAVPATPKLQDLLSQASQASTSGNKEQAIKLWKQTAAAYPADKTSWSNIAQTRYEAGQYGDAITAAEEVLVRDPNDIHANSIIAIAGLRLSTRALSELSRQKNLTGNVRTESQDLAKLLRESLNQDILIPNPSTANVQPKSNVKPANSGKNQPKAAKAEEKASADPFGSLK